MQRASSQGSTRGSLHGHSMGSNGFKTLDRREGQKQFLRVGQQDEPYSCPSSLSREFPGHGWEPNSADLTKQWRPKELKDVVKLLSNSMR